MSELSIHDNNVYAYTAICDQERIVLHTDFKDGTANEYTDVIFNGVIAHHVQDALAGNILFAIYEVTAEQIVNEWADLFAKRKNYGWPAVEYQSAQDLISLLEQRKIKGFEIGSSYGLSGWVLASSLELRPREHRMIFE